MPEFTRPRILSGKTYKVKTGYGNLFVIINYLNEKPIELFAIVGKSGKSIQAKTEALGRLISVCLQGGINPKEISSQLKGIAGDTPLATSEGVILSIPDALGQLLEEIGNDCKRADH